MKEPPEPNSFAGKFMRQKLKKQALRSVVWFMMVHDSPNDFLSIPNKILKSVLIIR